MLVLVTGGAGFIGSHLVDLLLAEGHQVRVLDDLSTGDAANLRHVSTSVELVEGSILDADLVERCVHGCDLVFHLAAAVGVGNVVRQPVRTILVNARGTEHVLDACARRGTRVVIASTSEVYGKTDRLPMREDDDRVLGSTAVVRWGYSTAKALDEHLAHAYAIEAGLPVSIVRYFNSYGPRLAANGYGSVVAAFIGQALAGRPLTVHGDGAQTRCFTFVADTVRGTYLAGTLPSALGTTVNLGSTVEITINELATAVSAAVGVEPHIEHIDHATRYGAGFEDTRRRVPSIERAAEVLGWRPTVELADGLARTVAWWRTEHQEVA